MTMKEHLTAHHTKMAKLCKATSEGMDDGDPLKNHFAHESDLHEACADAMGKAAGDDELNKIVPDRVMGIIPIDVPEDGFRATGRGNRAVVRPGGPPISSEGIAPELTKFVSIEE